MSAILVFRVPKPHAAERRSVRHHRPVHAPTAPAIEKVPAAHSLHELLVPSRPYPSLQDAQCCGAVLVQFARGAEALSIATAPLVQIHVWVVAAVAERVREAQGVLVSAHWAGMASAAALRRVVQQRAL